MSDRDCPAFIWDCHNDPYNSLSYDRPACECGQHVAAPDGAA